MVYISFLFMLMMLIYCNYICQIDVHFLVDHKHVIRKCILLAFKFIQPDYRNKFSEDERLQFHSFISVRSDN